MNFFYFWNYTTLSDQRNNTTVKRGQLFEARMARRDVTDAYIRTSARFVTNYRFKIIECLE